MKPTFKERLAYWFDSRMSKGTSDLIRLLAIVSVLAIALINNYTLLGYLRHETYESTFNPDLTDEIDLDGEDSLIVLAEN